MDYATRADQVHARKLARVEALLYPTRCRLDYMSILELMDRIR